MEKQDREALEGIARREAVNHPPHYNQGKIEVIDAIEDWGLDFNAGNVVKYITSKDPTCGESPPYSYLYPTPSL